MKNKMFCLVLMLFSVVGFAQSYIGTITKKVNFREGPGIDFGIISSLTPNSPVFIVSLDDENGFYNIIDIETNLEGFVNKSYVKVGKEVKKSNGSVFSRSGASVDENSHVSILNDTNKTLTLKMNDDLFYFKPHEEKVLTFEEGIYSFRASAPGVIPYLGAEKLEGRQDYSWQFYIVTR